MAPSLINWGEAETRAWGGSPEDSETPVASPGSGEQARPTIVMSGRVSRQKDPEWFVAAVERVRRERPDVRALWLGSDDDAALTELPSRPT